MPQFLESVLVYLSSGEKSKTKKDSGRIYTYSGAEYRDFLIFTFSAPVLIEFRP